MILSWYYIAHYCQFYHSGLIIYPLHHVTRVVNLLGMIHNSSNLNLAILNILTKFVPNNVSHPAFLQTAYVKFVSGYNFIIFLICWLFLFMSHPYSYKIDSYKKIFESTHVYKTTLPFVFDRSEEINKDVWIKGKVYLSLSERTSSVNLKIIFSFYVQTLTFLLTTSFYTKRFL